MSDILTLERVFSAPVKTVFAAISEPEQLFRWWGPQGMHVPEGALDFTEQNPWFSVMENGEGQQYKVSGHVLEIDAPSRIVFSWGWHEDYDQKRSDEAIRGHESEIVFEVSSAGEGQTKFTLSQRNFSSPDSLKAHQEGWASSLRKLERLFDPA